MLNIELSKIKRKEWILIYVFIILVIFSSSYNFIFSPLVREIKTVSAQIERKEGSIQKAKINPQFLKELEGEIEQLGAQMAYYEENLKALRDVPQILKELNQIAEHLDIKFVSVNPLERQKVPLPGDKEYFEQVPISIKLKCGYHQLGIFINRIESSAQFMKVTQLKISLEPKDIWNHQVELVITSFGLGGYKSLESES